jgi:hypothetical protein
VLDVKARRIQLDLLLKLLCRLLHSGEEGLESLHYWYDGSGISLTVWCVGWISVTYNLRSLEEVNCAVHPNFVEVD